MTNFLTNVGAMLTAVGVSLLSVSCGGGDKDGDGNGKGGDAGGGKSLHDQMVGYWAPNEAQIDEMVKAQAGDDPAAAAFLPMIKAMMANMAVEVTKDEVRVNGMGDEGETIKYKVLSEDKDTGTVVMEVDENGDINKNTAKIDGDTITIEQEGEEGAMAFTRITKEEFEKKKKAAAEATGGFGLPGGDPAPTPPGE